MPNPAVSTAGVASALSLPEHAQVDLTSHARSGARRLSQAIGATNYALVLSDSATLTDAQLESAILAGQLFGASSYLRKLQPAVSNRGVMMSATSASGSSESFASAEQVAAMARNLRDQAILELKESGLYQRPTSVNVTRVEVDEDDA